jgi:hypothetical protein
VISLCSPNRPAAAHNWLSVTSTNRTRVVKPSCCYQLSIFLNHLSSHDCHLIKTNAHQKLSMFFCNGWSSNYYSPIDQHNFPLPSDNVLETWKLLQLLFTYWPVYLSSS